MMQYQDLKIARLYEENDRRLTGGQRNSISQIIAQIGRIHGTLLETAGRLASSGQVLEPQVSVSPKNVYVFLPHTPPNGLPKDAPRVPSDWNQLFELEHAGPSAFWKDGRVMIAVPAAVDDDLSARLGKAAETLSRFADTVTERRAVSNVLNEDTGEPDSFGSVEDTQVARHAASVLRKKIMDKISTRHGSSIT